MESPSAVHTVPASAPPADVASTAPPPAAEPASVCPRCQTKLVDPAGLGWCETCGYCRSLEEDRARLASVDVATAAKPASSGDFFRLMLHLPGWFWLLTLGMALLAVASFISGRYLPPDSLERAICCTAQIGVGLVMILGAQFWALMFLAPVDGSLGTKDALLPTRLWPHILTRLPAMRWHLWIAGWGLSIIVSALVFIGGLSHWMKYLPGSKTPAATTTARK